MVAENLDPGEMSHTDERSALSDAVNRYLKDSGDLVLDVANPVGRPSLGGIEEQDYVCVNPGNNDGRQDSYTFRAGDGLDPDDINAVIDEHDADEAAYLVVQGVSQLFDYYVTDFDHVEHMNDRDERRRRVADVYAENLAEMEVDTVVMAESLVDTGHENGYAMGDMTVGQVDYFADRLEEEGFQTEQHVYSETGPTQNTLLVAER